MTKTVDVKPIRSKKIDIRKIGKVLMCVLRFFFRIVSFIFSIAGPFRKPHYVDNENRYLLNEFLKEELRKKQQSK